MWKKMNLDMDLILFTKINPKRIPGLNAKCTTITPLEENTGENLGDLGYGNDFLDTMLKAKSRKGIIKKQDCIKMKNICSAEDIIKKMRRQATDWEKIFLNNI